MNQNLVSKPGDVLYLIGLTKVSVAKNCSNSDDLYRCFSIDMFMDGRKLERSTNRHMKACKE